LLVAQFNESNGRLPNNSEFIGLVSPLLNQPLSAPAAISISNVSATVWSPSTASLKAWLTQGIYGEDGAGVIAYWGTNNAGASMAGWQNSAVLGVNTNFNPSSWSLLITNLSPGAAYYYAFRASNPSNQVWSPVGQLTTAGVSPSNYGRRVKITFPAALNPPLSGYPALVSLSPATPGFAYSQFASPTGGDLRFTDAGGLTPLPYEVNRWNPSGTSTFWVLLPELGATNDFIWAYWGNAAETNPPASTTNGAVWASYIGVWHLEQASFPYLDSALRHPLNPGAAATSAPGWAGQGASFNGNAWLDAGTVNLGQSFTLSAWVNLQPGAANIQAIFANKPGGWNSDGVSLYIDTYNTSDRAVLLETGNGTTGTTAQTGAGAISDGQWHLITATVDASNGVGQIFVDGVNQTQSSVVTTKFANATDLQIGRFTDGSFAFHGVIDEARIQAGWASPAWVEADHSLSVSLSPINPPPAISLLSAASGGSASLAWAASDGVFSVYSTTNLAPPAVWLPESNLPALANGEWTLPLAATDAIRFYRLQAR
jgi:hypothetical protein